ncbi:hypothetical protein ACLOJK_027308 [Asimina triloba]
MVSGGQLAMLEKVEGTFFQPPPSSFHPTCSQNQTSKLSSLLLPPSTHLPSSNSSRYTPMFSTLASLTALLLKLTLSSSLDYAISIFFCFSSFSVFPSHANSLLCNLLLKYLSKSSRHDIALLIYARSKNDGVSSRYFSGPHLESLHCRKGQS